MDILIVAINFVVFDISLIIIASTIGLLSVNEYLKPKNTKNIP